MKTGITNAAQIQNNTIINTTRIVKGYAFDDATLVPITIKNPYNFGYNNGFIDNLLLDLDLNNYEVVSPLKDFENEQQTLNPKINITSTLQTRISCYYNYTEGQQFFYVPPPSDLDLRINDELQEIKELPNDSGLSVMSGIHGIDRTFNVGKTYTFTCNSKYKLSVSQITIDDAFITQYWSFGSTKFQADKLRFSIRIENV